MNNGGTSQLFIDFSPLGGGQVGQVIRYLHDPDSYAVIADGFEEYLQSLFNGGYAFVQ
jgi:cell wall assembly regulator SMI1